MRRLLLAIWLPATLGCLFLGLLGCGPKPLPAESYLEPFRPILTIGTAEEEVQWEQNPRYQITATLDTDAMILQGRQRVRFVNREGHNLREVVFRLYPNLPHYHGRMTIDSVGTRDIAVDFTYDAASTAVRLACVPPLEPGQIAELDLGFTVEIGDVESGTVRFGRSQNIISLPAFYPMVAAYDARGWRREIAPSYAGKGFSDVSFYEVTLFHDPDLVIAATGKVISQTLNSDGMMTSQFVAGPIREFAIIASPDYEVAETEAFGIVVQSYFLRQDRGAGLIALWSTASALRVYINAFGPYPYTVLSVAQAPLGAGSMEFSTLNLVGIDAYRTQLRQMTYLIAHEVAHQWWYGQVGSDPFQYPWLDQGLAELSTYHYFTEVHGRESAQLLREIRWENLLDQAHATEMNTALSQPVTAFASERAYRSTVYAKSALFFDTLRRALGDETFYSILREYVRRYRFQIVGPEHFLLVAQEVSGRDLSPLIREWILGDE